MTEMQQACLDPVAGHLRHYLYPGGIFVDPRPHLVTTVLGSCVSICLWDTVCKIGGINHYMLPLRNGEGLSSPKYGNVAIPKLINKMCQLGCREDDLVGKIFGGACMWQSVTRQAGVGAQNIAQALQLLDEQGIRIISHDVGGKIGRKIVFNTENGVVLLRRIGKNQNPDRSGS